MANPQTWADSISPETTTPESDSISARKHRTAHDFRALAWLIASAEISMLIGTGGNVHALYKIPWLWGHCVFITIGLLSYLFGTFLWKTRIVLTGEGIWDVGGYYLPRLIRWEEITNVQARGLGWRGHGYIPTKAIIRHPGGKYNLYLDSFEHPIAVIRKLRNHLPKTCPLDPAFEKYITDQQDA